ncbi:hypothetical protein J3E68DRAFT_239043 [Trichoderma sp. SZMC 28012]
MISCGEGKNTPRNWQLNTCSLHFYPFFHFYFFIFYNHLAILDYEARPISSCIPLSFCIHNQALAFGELAERRSVQQKKKKIPERNSLYSPRIADHVLLVWTTGQQWANGKKAPGPSLFLYLVWRTRALLRPDTTFLQQQRGVAASAYELQYTGARGRRRTRKRDGLGWIGLASGILGTGEALSYFKLGGSRAACIWTFFHLF